MVHSSSLATLIVASRLSCDLWADYSRHGVVGLNEESGIASDQEEMLNSLFCGASVVLAVAIALSFAASHLPSLSFDLNVDPPVLMGAVDDADDVKAPVEKPKIISTRRQRRATDTSSCNYSDFCDNDLSRQIEAMVLEVETAYENRPARKQKQVIVQPASIKEEVDLSSCITPMKKLSQDNIMYTLNTPAEISLSKPSKGAPSAQNNNSFQLLRRTLQPVYKNDDVPEMQPCDSLASLSSDYSLMSMSSMRSSSNFLSAPPGKKNRSIMPRSNAEWAIME